MLITSQFQDLNNKLSAFVEKRGPSIVTTVPLRDHMLGWFVTSGLSNTSSAACATIDDVSLQKVAEEPGCRELSATCKEGEGRE